MSSTGARQPETGVQLQGYRQGRCCLRSARSAQTSRGRDSRVARFKGIGKADRVLRTPPPGRRRLSSPAERLCQLLVGRWLRYAARAGLTAGLPHFAALRHQARYGVPHRLQFGRSTPFWVVVRVFLPQPASLVGQAPLF